MITAKCARYREHGKPWHRSRLQNLDDYDIVRIYGAEYRGVVELLPARPGRLAAAPLRWAMETSMLKTLGAMRRTAISPAKRAEMRGDYLWI